jgi:hypothetical protein
MSRLIYPCPAVSREDNEVGTRGEGDEFRVDGDGELIGSIGVLTIATRGPAGPGEVLVRIRGGSETFIAWSPEPLARGSTVLVIETRGSRAVDVSPWNDPFGHFPDG